VSSRPVRTRLPVPPIVLRDARDVRVARVALGLTLYLDDALPWARGGAAAALRAFVAAAPSGRLRWYTTSAMDTWDRCGSDTLARLADSLTLPWGSVAPRHCFELRVADDTDAPALGFSYREVDAARRGGAGWLQIVLPDDHDPSDLLHLALELGHAHPFLGGVGGYVAAWNRDQRAAAFRAMRAWCKRYVGMDVQDPDAMSWRARAALPGIGWLTLLGPGLLRALPGACDLAAPWHEPVAVMPLSHGTLVRAGERPTLGDLNALVYPAAYAEVAHRLAPLLPADPRPFPQWGDDAMETAAWVRRFVAPEGWS